MIQSTREHPRPGGRSALTGATGFQASSWFPWTFCQAQGPRVSRGSWERGAAITFPFSALRQLFELLACARPWGTARSAREIDHGTFLAFSAMGEAGIVSSGSTEKDTHEDCSEEAVSKEEAGIASKANPTGESKQGPVFRGLGGVHAGCCFWRARGAILQETRLDLKGSWLLP